MIKPNSKTPIENFHRINYWVVIVFLGKKLYSSLKECVDKIVC